MSAATVTSVYAFFGVMRTRPSGRSSRRSWAIGGRAYARRLRHGEIGKGLNDYAAILAELRDAGFDGWTSIEDGVEGLDQLKRSAGFLRAKIRRYWP